ncbi:hypothetical protein [Salinimicrobium sediminilitoris]|uniref:hypothetical protein n=1 Tax=Salinimicrobium sediminilitoris TaxID=2876715 RepID=UPI001E3C2331|nr:hypothetical protein [Salinimicrobium sediminilitoris]MCC8359325.1 hypothetical protein [Salinimicrobium sediminilitoris]
MIKSPHFIFIFLFAGLLISCSGDNLYEFKELTRKKDIIIEVIVIPEDGNEEYDFQAVFFQTDGYGERVNKSVGYNGSEEIKVVSGAVKKYKKAGVTFTPINNVSKIGVRIYDLLYDTDIWFWAFDNIEGEITISYDFDLDKAEIIQE